MEQLKQVKEAILGQVLAQIGDLKQVNTHELGEVIDMVKDLEESMYYCSVTKAMEESSENKEKQSYYLTKYLPPYEEQYYRDTERSEGRMYYPSRDMRMVNRPHMDDHTSYPVTMRDSREGKSPISRKAYMESKEMHQDKAIQMKELESYLNELSSDITEMIQQATPEEKAILQKKLMTLSNKIV